MAERIIEAEDLFRFKVPYTPKLSPDGRRVIFAVRGFEGASKQATSHLWMLELESKRSRQFTYGIQWDEAPQWSPDGQWIAFLSKRNSLGKQLYVISAQGGEARQLTEMKGDFSSFSWSPDALRIVFSFRRWDTNEQEKKEPPLSRRVKSLTWKTDTDGYLPQDKYHLYLLSLESGNSTQCTFGEYDDSAPAFSPDGKDIAFLSNRREGNDRDFINQDIYTLNVEFAESSKGPRRLTQEKGPAFAPVWSPDGLQLAYLGNRGGPGTYLIAPIHAWTVSRDGLVEEDRMPGQDLMCMQLTLGDIHGLDAMVQPIIWAPDGSCLYFVASERGSTLLYRLQLTKSPMRHNTLDGPFPLLKESQEHVVLVQQDFAIEDTPSPPLDSPDSAPTPPTDEVEAVRLPDTQETNSFTKPLQYQSIDTLESPSFVELSGLSDYLSNPENEPYNSKPQAAEPIFEALGVCQGFDLDTTGSKIVLVWSNSLDPGELYLFDLRKGRLEKLTSFNENVLDELSLSEPEEFRFASQDGTEIQGWLMRPPEDLEIPEQIPLIVQIHGGPACLYGNTFYHEFQWMAGKGYAVLFANPRGSQGYGLRFAKAIDRAWAEKPMEDIIAGVEFVLASGTIDGHRMAITGGSYGGYLTNWIISHTNRFQAAVTQRCVSNWADLFYSAEFGSNIEFELRATPWDEPELYRELSPIHYAQHIQTPLLILHAENDFNCPVSQAEQLFTKLKILGKTTEMVLFPGANHNLSRGGKPAQRLERLHCMMEWFQRFL